MDVNWEKSCGAVVYRVRESQLQVLLLQHNAGHWAFPKGHVENDETEAQTATREIWEETGLCAKVDERFRFETEFLPKPQTMKRVVCFVACASSGEERPLLSEVQRLRWCTPADALQLITYENDKDLLRQAVEYLNTKENWL